MAKKKVFIGVGHGGVDPGAVGNGLKESDINLGIALECEKVLKANGVDAKCSRYKEENDDLAEEIRECKAFNPDLAIDVHTNSASAQNGDGWEAIHHYGGGQGKVLAQNIEKEVLAIGQNSRGLKTKKNSSGSDYFGFIRQIPCPAIILECAFINNPNDIKIVDTRSEQALFGKAYAKGILKTLGIKYSGDGSNSKPSTSSPKPPVQPSKPQGNDWVLKLQKELNKQGYKDKNGRKLVEDGFVGELTLSACPTLKQGAKGNITKLMQEKLNSLGYSTNGIDGNFGNGTKNAVIKFQKAKKISADGIVGQGTWRKLLGL
ncbi:MAG: N-acetylmuramoyl-L-alanine amidase [Sarcina sp.]